MPKTVFVFLFIALTTLVQAQAPMNVPSQITVAGVKLKLNGEAQKEVAETLDLLTRSQYHFQLKVDRSNLYMHFVEEVLREEGIPEDFKYLAIQEGEFISDAVSTSNAVGFWQFKKASAQELGVRVDDQVDERKHIIASSIGATKYLKRSNFVFDNWVLSMQSYLQGLTGTQRSVPDKWYGAKSMNITGKSHWYIKKFIAHKLAFQDFVGEGRKHPEIQLMTYEGRGKTLKEVSRTVNADLDQVKLYNKWLKKSRIPDDKSYMVIYPSKSGNPIARKEEKPKTENPEGVKKSEPGTQAGPASEKVRDYYGIKPVDGNTGLYPVISGNTANAYAPGYIKLNGIAAIKARSNESLAELAGRAGKSESKLKKYNDLSDQFQFSGDRYYYLKAKKSKGKVHYHIVLPGETCWSISQDYGIQLKKLLRKNRMRKAEELKVGRVLWLRFIRPANVPIEYANVLQVEQEPAPVVQNPVQKAAVAPAIKSEPEKKAPERVAKQKPLLVPSETHEVVKHTVKEKETFFAIAALYDVEIDQILTWNALSIADGLKIDQVLQLKVERAPVKEPVAKIHTVVKGETLWSISKKYGVTIDQIKKWNRKSDLSLALGEKLKILVNN